MVGRQLAGVLHDHDPLVRRHQREQSREQGRLARSGAAADQERQPGLDQPLQHLRGTRRSCEPVRDAVIQGERPAGRHPERDAGAGRGNWVPSTACTRVPSASRASTNGEESSSRRPMDAASRWARRRTSPSRAEPHVGQLQSGPRSTQTWSGPLTSTSVTPGSRSSRVQRSRADAVPSQRLDRLDQRGVGDAADPRPASRRRRRRGCGGRPRSASRSPDRLEVDAVRVCMPRSRRRRSAGAGWPAPRSTLAAATAASSRADRPAVRPARRPADRRDRRRRCRAAAAPDPRPPAVGRQRLTRPRRTSTGPTSHRRHRHATSSRRRRESAQVVAGPGARSGRPAGGSPGRPVTEPARQVHDGQVVTAVRRSSTAASVPRPSPSPMALTGRAMASRSTPSTVGSWPVRSPRCPRARGEPRPAPTVHVFGPQQQIEAAAERVAVDQQAALPGSLPQRRPGRRRRWTRRRHRMHPTTATSRPRRSAVAPRRPGRSRQPSGRRAA